MGDFENTLALSSSAMSAQTKRLRLVTENIANADTPGYRRKTTSFETVFDRNTESSVLKTGRVNLDPGEREKVFDPGHPLADASGHYQGSNVDLVIEIADARSSQRSYEANLRMFDQARNMASAALELLRR